MDKWGVSQAEGRLVFISVMFISISLIGMKLAMPMLVNELT